MSAHQHSPCGIRLATSKIQAFNWGKRRSVVPSAITMTGQLSTKQNWLKRLMITTLAILLSGTNCLFCCGQLITFAAPVEEDNCATRSHESVSNDNCCSESPGESKDSESAPCNDDCCILSAPLAEMPSGAQSGQLFAATAQAALLFKATELARQPSLPSRQVRSIHQEATYLRCCVFLI